jgi:hypothetical protein
MKPGDLVFRVQWDGSYSKLIGFVLKVTMSRSQIPMYKIFWSDGIIKEHTTGTVRRFLVYEGVNQ